jgi:hypothetical protein
VSTAIVATVTDPAARSPDVNDRAATHPDDLSRTYRRDAAADRRDRTAVGRDERAATRDTAAAERDRAAQHRDRGATARDTAAGQRSHDVHDRLHDLHQQIDDRLRRHAESVAHLPAGDLPPAAATALRAYAAEQRRRADLDRQALSALIDEVRAEVEHTRADRRAAADNRQDAGEDRRGAADDRIAAAVDRDTSAADRDQAVIERAQADPPAHHAQAGETPPLATLTDRARRAVAESRQRIHDSRAARSQRAQPPEPEPATDDSTAGGDE